MTKKELNSFQHLKKLKKLDLSCNQIEQIETNVFQSLENLIEFKIKKLATRYRRSVGPEPYRTS